MRGGLTARQVLQLRGISQLAWIALLPSSAAARNNQVPSQVKLSIRRIVGQRVEMQTKWSVVWQHIGGTVENFPRSNVLLRWAVVKSIETCD